MGSGEKRMMSNRESARRSRMKKQKLMEDLVAEKAALERRNREMREEHDELERKWRHLQLSNTLLAADKARWTHCFHFLCSLATSPRQLLS